jgi:hypothetical protein
MMNGRRKSDRPVVATKPANKVGATAHEVAASMAERVERRGLAKGKPPGQNTNRAQDREVVQSALARIRQAAVKDKQAKFTSLMHVAHWYWTLRRRSQTRRLTWTRMVPLANRWLPPPTLHHPYPLRRLGVIT